MINLLKTTVYNRINGKSRLQAGNHDRNHVFIVFLTGKSCPADTIRKGNYDFDAIL